MNPAVFCFFGIVTGPDKGRPIRASNADWFGSETSCKADDGFVGGKKAKLGSPGQSPGLSWRETKYLRSGIRRGRGFEIFSNGRDGNSYRRPVFPATRLTCFAVCNLSPAWAIATLASFRPRDIKTRRVSCCAAGSFGSHQPI